MQKMQGRNFLPRHHGFGMTSMDGGNAEQMSGTFAACVALIRTSMHFLLGMTAPSN